jgi:hypothetical protein
MSNQLNTLLSKFTSGEVTGERREMEECVLVI